MRQRQEQFKAELRALLARYNAEIQIDDVNTRSYYGTEEMIVTLDGVFDDNHKMVHEFESFSIGRWCSGESV